MAAAERASQSIRVSERTGPLHPLVARTNAAIANAHANYRGMVTAHEKGCLGISVGMKSNGRAIRIMNALVRGLEARGFPVSVGLDDRKPVTVAKINDEEVMFRLEEGQSMKKRVKKPGDTYFYEGYDHVPSGKLTLTVVPQGTIELAQQRLAMLKKAVLDFARANQGGITNADAASMLGLRSDYRNHQKDYITYSILGLLLREGKIIRVDSSRHHCATGE